MNINVNRNGSEVSGFMDMEPLNADPARNAAFLKNYLQFISITSDGFPIFMKTVSFIYLSSSAGLASLYELRDYRDDEISGFIFSSSLASLTNPT